MKYYVYCRDHQTEDGFAHSKDYKDKLVTYLKAFGEVKVYKLTEIEHYDRKVV